MRSLAALVALALVACAAPTSEAPHAAALASAPAPAHTLWLEPGELGHDEQARWGLPLPAGFRVEVLEREAFFDLCASIAPEPCPRSTWGWTQLPGRVVMRADLAPEDFSLALTHELGHVLRGEAGHLPCEGGEQHVMCERGNADTLPSWPTPEDFAFVLGEAQP